MSLLKKPSNTTQTFVALLIEEQSVQAGIWQAEAQETRVVALGEKQIWGSKDLSELIESSDLSLSAAIAKITEAGLAQPQKIVFGLPFSWTKEGQIVSSRQDWLKEIASKLDLKPIGFVITNEALAHYLRVNEGAPISVILVGLREEKIEITLLSLGKIIGIEEVVRSENLALDVEEGLLRFLKLDSLPPRLILYGEGDLEAARQGLLAFPWQEPGKELNFLHFPKVELGRENWAVESLCLAGGTEMVASQKLVGQGEEEPVIEEEEGKEAKEEVDIETETKEVDLGFVRDKDVLAEKGRKEDQGEDREEDKKAIPIKEEKIKDRSDDLALGVKDFANLLLSKIKISRPKLTEKLPPFVLVPPKLVLAGAVFVFLGGIVWFYQTVPRAEIVLSLTPEELQQTYELSLQPNASGSDIEKMILPARLAETTLTGSQTRTTTGKKTVGEKAKGEVIIYNRTDARRVFEAGLVLVGPGGLEFELDGEVAVASKTADLLSGVDRWGEATVGVTAVDIGAGYNLAADSQLAFKNYVTSLYLAKNKAAFEGGSSRQVQAVAEEDREGLKNDLKQELEQKAKQEFLAAVGAGQKLIEESLQIESTKTEFSRQSGEEAQEVSLTLATKASGLVFEELVLENFLRSLLKEQIGKQEFRWEESELNFEILEIEEGGAARARAEWRGKLYPSLDDREITQNLAGKSFDFQRKYLTSLPKVTGFEIKITPNFFVRLGRLPVRPANIKITIKGD